MFEMDMRSHLTNLIPPIGFESLYDLTTAHESILHSYTHNTRKRFHTTISKTGPGANDGLGLRYALLYTWTVHDDDLLKRTRIM